MSIWKTIIYKTSRLLLWIKFLLESCICTQKKKSYQQLEIWGQIAPQLCIIKL